MAPDHVISFQQHEKAVIAAVLRRALDDATAKRLDAEISAAASAAPGLAVILDMSKVEFAPSVALGTLVALAKDLKFSGHQLIVVGLTRQVRGTFAVTRLDKLLEIRGTAAEALEHLARTK